MYTAYYFVKTDNVGDTLFTKYYYKLDSSYGFGLSQLTDGYIFIGITQTYFQNGSTGPFLVRTNILGDTLWTKKLGGSFYDDAYSIQKTSDGGFIIFGTTRSFGVIGYDVYIIKTGSDGTVQWSKTYGGIGDDFGSKGIVTIDSGYAVVGYTNSFGMGGYDVYLLKLDQNGDTLWSRTFGGPDDDQASSIQQTTDGGFIISGYTNISGSNYSSYLIKTDSNGMVNTITGNSENTKYPRSLSLSPNPTTGPIHMQFPQTFGQAKTLEIYNSLGQLLTRQTGETHLDISCYVAGLYFVIATNDKGETLSAKVVKE